MFDAAPTNTGDLVCLDQMPEESLFVEADGQLVPDFCG